ncbi:hypothetical protein [Amycolatopsis eburnea]|nr:hypothetical protein [Amycolatopsis eburnea]
MSTPAPATPPASPSRVGPTPGADRPGARFQTPPPDQGGQHAQR